MSRFVYELPPGDSLQVSEEPFGKYGGSEEYTPATFARAMGTAEWFLAYTIQENGTVEGLSESSTYSLSITPDGKARVTNYNLTKNRSTGKLFTLQDSQEGEWDISGHLFVIRLPDETLEFIVTSIEHGVMQTIDPDYNTGSVFMTEAAFKVALRHLRDN